MWVTIEVKGQKYKYQLNEGASVIGRDPSCDICFHEPSLSRRHVECVLKEGHLVVRDLDSKNGTFLGIQRIHEVHVQPGIRLRVGNVWLGFQEEESDTGPAVTAPAAAISGAGAKAREASEEELSELERMVPKAEGYEEEEEPTPLDESVAQAIAAESGAGGGANVVVRDDRWYVRDALTGIEVEIVPVQREGAKPTPATPPAPAPAGGTPPDTTPKRAGLPAVVPRRLDMKPIARATIEELPPRSFFAGLVATPVRRVLLIIVPILLAAGITFLIFSRPPEPIPKIPRFRYRTIVRKAIEAFKKGEREQALDTVTDLQRQPVQGTPKLANRLRDAFAHDEQAVKDFEKAVTRAKNSWEEVRDHHESMEEAEQLARDRLAWIRSESYNMASLNEAKTAVRSGDLAGAVTLAGQVSQSSLFHKRAQDLAAKTKQALVKAAESQAAANAKAQKWADAIRNLREIIKYAPDRDGELKPKIAEYQKNEKDRAALARAKTLAGKNDYAGALKALAAIDDKSLYAKQRDALRKESATKGAVQTALAAYHAGDAPRAVKMLTDVGRKDSKECRNIQAILRAFERAQNALKADSFLLAEQEFKAIVSLESNKGNHYVKESQRLLGQMGPLKTKRSKELVAEVTSAMRDRKFRQAREKLDKARRLDPANKIADELEKKMKNEAILEFNRGANMARDRAKEALAILQEVKDRLPPYDAIYHKADLELQKIRIRLEKEKKNSN